MKTTMQRCYGFACDHLETLAAFVLAFVLLLAPLTAYAQQATNGQNGGNAGTKSGGSGANGSDGVLLSGVTSVAGGTFTAGSGGDGGSAGIGSQTIFGVHPTDGGNGGNGGNAAVAQAGSVVTVTGGTFTAGSGGNGGGSDIFGGGGGRGGSGGSALVALTGSTVTVTGGTFSVGHNGSAGVLAPFGGAGGHAGYDLLANGGAITVYGANFSAGPSLTGSGTLTATIGGVTQTLSYSVSSAAGSAIFLAGLGTLATTTTLTASPNPSAASQSVTLTAAVTPVDPTSGTPTGSVTFEVGSTFLSPVPLVNGTATLTTSTLSVGSDTVTAYYSGDSRFAGSNVSFVQTVNSVTQTTLTSNHNSSVVGQSVTFTAAVTAADSPTPTGSVQFAIDGANVGGPVTLDGSGQATDTEAGLTLGAHTITVSYVPTGIFLGNSGATLTQNVYPHLSPQYVSPSGSDRSDGSQASPKQTIQAAINATQSGDTVIVEGGTYAGNGNRDIDFGGRNITVRAASGDPTQAVIDCGGSASSLHRGFTFHSGETNAVVSGLTVRNGFQFGGAIDIARGSAVTLTNCILTGNVAHGGSFFPGLNLGGSIDNAGTTTLTNCTITGNSANLGSGVYNAGTLTLTNDILYGDTGKEIFGTVTATHCDVQGGYAGTGNLNADPLFVNAAAGDFHLLPGSPCLGAGTRAGAPATDLDGHRRPDPPSIGAYDIAPASHTHLLWTSASGAAAIWTLDSAGSITSTPAFGPIPGWTAKSIADGTDGLTRLLWTRSDGMSAVWTVNTADGSITSTPGYGPYDGGRWNVASLAVGQDNLTRLLWKHSPDGQSSVWTVAADGSFVSTPGYGPYGSWMAGALAVGSDGLSRLLWEDGTGQFSVWTLDGFGGFISTPAFGPIPGWTASALAGGPDQDVRLLLNRLDGAMAVWTVDVPGSVTSTPLYGPISGWVCHGLAVGPDALSRVLWSRNDGASAVWTVNASSSIVSTPLYGPILGWNAVGISAGP